MAAPPESDFDFRSCLSHLQLNFHHGPAPAVSATPGWRSLWNPSFSRSRYNCRAGRLGNT